MAPTSLDDDDDNADDAVGGESTLGAVQSVFMWIWKIPYNNEKVIIFYLCLVPETGNVPKVLPEYLSKSTMTEGGEGAVNLPDNSGEMTIVLNPGETLTVQHLNAVESQQPPPPGVDPNAPPGTSAIPPLLPTSEVRDAFFNRSEQPGEHFSSQHHSASMRSYGKWTEEDWAAAGCEDSGCIFFDKVDLAEEIVNTHYSFVKNLALSSMEEEERPSTPAAASLSATTDLVDPDVREALDQIVSQIGKLIQRQYTDICQFYFFLR